MSQLKVFVHNTKIDFSGLRHLCYGLALTFSITSLLFVFFKGVNLGIDFKGGLLIEVRTNQNVELSDLRKTLKTLNLGEVKIQSFGSDKDILIRIEHQPGGNKAQTLAAEKIRALLGEAFDFRRVEILGPKVSKDLIENGIMAVLFAMVGMLLYIWLRFEWQYSICAIIALVHDAIAVIGFYAISGYEFNEAALAAILTTIGYSINDTVVVYDRLRETLRKYKKTPMTGIINLSANNIFYCTIVTSGTTLLALAALSLFGGPVVENFSTPIFVGVIAGTFSSIFLSANLLLFFNLRKRKIKTQASTL
ncbi:MAG TPA: protein translocase subunit SecF [Holosporales bacterium]|nr:protein translocase subunit SecF [Holosporales bacterium]